MKTKFNGILALLFAFIVQMSFAQNKTISGVVSDESGPLPGVGVFIKGTKTGTETDFDGKYSIKTKIGNVLIFSFVGMKTVEKTVGTSNTLNVVMSNDNVLEEVVVTALGNSKEKRSLGYDVSTVDSERIKEGGETNIVNSLSGKASGVQVTSSSGAAGGSSFIKIRGNASFTGNNQPLFVIDGIPVTNEGGSDANALQGSVALSNRMVDINPDDIESVSILKGGAATAAYGSRAANGVVLVTTKKGRYNSDVKITLNTGLEISEVNKLPETNTTYSQGLGSFAGGSTSGFSWGPAISELGFDATGNITDDTANMVPGSQGTVPSFNNPQNFFQKGIKRTISLSLSGGSAKTRYFISAANLDEEGIVPRNTFKRNNISANINTSINDKFKVGASIKYANTKGRRIQQGSNTSGLMLGLLRTPPSFDNSNGTTNARDQSAFLNADGSQRNYRAGVGYDNPYWTINMSPYTDEVNRVISNLNLKYDLTPEIKLNYRGGADYYTRFFNDFIAINSRTAPAGRITQGSNDRMELDHNFFASFDYNFTNDITFDGTLGYNINSRLFKGTGVQGDGLQVQGFNNIANASTITAPAIFNTTPSEIRTAALYADATFGYKNYLFMTLTGRLESASTFGPQTDETFFYPSISSSFVFSDAFGIDPDILSFGKLKASYAQVGNQPVFGITETYYGIGGAVTGWTNGTTFPLNGVTSYTFGNAAGNPLLKPEKLTNFEVGTDLKFANNRYGIEFTYYNNKSEDLILAVPVAASSGITNQWINAGTMVNKGYELEFFADIIKNDDFSWTLSGSWTKNINKVEKLADGVDVISLPGGFNSANGRLVKGEAYGTLYGQVWEKDANGNTLIDDNGYPITAAATDIIGDPNPDWIAGITNSLSYKNLDFSFLFDIRKGGDLWNGTKGALYFFGAHGEQVPNRGEYFVYPGISKSTGQPNTTPIINDWQSYAGASLSGFTGASEPFVEDGGWVRLRNVNLGYTFKDKWLDNTFVDGLKVTFTGRNLLLWTNYSGIDPETNLSGATNSQGLDYFNMPNTRSYSVNIKATF